MKIQIRKIATFIRLIMMRVGKDEVSRDQGQLRGLLG